jgi:hypothetical protein
MPDWMHDLIVSVVGFTILFGYMIALAAWDNRSCRRKRDDAPGEKLKK